MVELQLKYGLPFCSVKLNYKGKEITLNDVLLDTGSGGMDKVEEIGITIEEEDTVETISGVGVSKFVYKKFLDVIEIGEIKEK